MRKSKAFTLIELLVVISIIGILAVGAGASYTVSQKRARDARRKTDLKSIAAAFEQYYSVCGYIYPTPASSLVPDSVICSSPSITIMSSTPKDPQTGTKYSMPAGGSTFTITTTLESETPSSYSVNNQQ